MFPDVIVHQQRRTPTHESLWRHDEVGSAVARGSLEFEHDLTRSVGLHALVGQCRARDVAAQLFQPLAAIRELAFEPLLESLGISAVMRTAIHRGARSRKAASWREVLSVQRRVTASLVQRDGRTLRVRKPTRPEPDIVRLYDALGPAHRPGGVQKLIV